MNKKNIKTKILFLLISLLTAYTYINISSKPNNDSIEELQKSLATKIVRFHVIANSDSQEDQELKLKVKQAVVEYISPLLKNSSSIQESKQILLEHQNVIMDIANNVVSSNGYNYEVSATLSTTYFPTKSYGKFTFPPGDYEAYEIKIGKANGRNWWCVLYPPLCFVDISHGVVDESSDEMLHSILTTDEYNSISGNENVEYRFKYLTFLNDLF